LKKTLKERLRKKTKNRRRNKVVRSRERGLFGNRMTPARAKTGVRQNFQDGKQKRNTTGGTPRENAHFHTRNRDSSAFYWSETAGKVIRFARGRSRKKGSIEPHLEHYLKKGDQDAST